jgi:putative endonuclease
MKLKNKSFDTGLTVYVLLLENNTYYVGLTSDLNKRLKQHQNNKGANFTKNQAFKLVEAFRIPVTTLKEGELYEDFFVMKYASTYGSLNVKGGSFLGSLKKRESRFKFYEQIFMKSSTVEEYVNSLKEMKTPSTAFEA